MKAALPSVDDRDDGQNNRETSQIRVCFGLPCALAGAEPSQTYLIERCTHSVLEGLLIEALVIGAADICGGASNAS